MVMPSCKCPEARRARCCHMTTAPRSVGGRLPGGAARGRGQAAAGGRDHRHRPRLLQAGARRAARAARRHCGRRRRARCVHPPWSYAVSAIASTLAPALAQARAATVQTRACDHAWQRFKNGQVAQRWHARAPVLVPHTDSSVCMPGAMGWGIPYSVQRRAPRRRRACAGGLV